MFHSRHIASAYYATAMSSRALVSQRCSRVNSSGRDLSSLGWRWGRTRFQVICYLIPLGYASVTYTFVWLTGFGGFYNQDFVASVSKAFGLGAMPS